MSEPFAPLLPALSTFAASICSNPISRNGARPRWQSPLGTGAFALKSWSRGQEVVLVRNTIGRRKPYLDGVVFRDVGDDNARTVNWPQATSI